MDNIKRANKFRVGDSRRKKRYKGIKSVFEEIMTENFPNLKREVDIQIQEACRVPKKMNPNRPTPRHITINSKI